MDLLFTFHDKGKLKTEARAQLNIEDHEKGRVNLAKY